MAPNRPQPREVRLPDLSKIPPDLVKHRRIPSIASELLRFGMEEEDGEMNVHIARPAVSDRHWMLDGIFRLIYSPFG